MPNNSQILEQFVLFYYITQNTIYHTACRDHGVCTQNINLNSCTNLWIYESRAMSEKTVTCMYMYMCELPGQIIITDEQQVLHHGQEVVFSPWVLHSVD